MMPTDANAERVVTKPADSGATSRGIASDPDDSMDLLDLALVLGARRRFIFLVSFIAALLTAIVVVVLPVTFTATTTMLPPQKEESSAMAMLSQVGGLAALTGGGGGAASMLGLKNPDDLYVGLLESDSVVDGIIRRFDLMRIYKKKRLSDARKQLKSNTKILAEKSSLISVSVEDHDAKRAAAMANGYIAGLHDLMSHLAVTSAAQRRQFFGQQVAQTKSKLTDAEVALEETEKKTGMIQPRGQAAAVIATIMQLRAQISASEVELGALRTSATDQNPAVITLQSQIAGLRAQLTDFEKGHPGAGSLAGNVLTPTSQVPAVSLEYLRRTRDVRYQETLFEFMTKQYEMAKVDEARQGQIIQVVDKASVPDRRSWPPRTLLTLLALILGAILSSFWVMLQSAYRHAMQDPELAPKVTELRRTLRIRRRN
ncbi:MAG: GNVR domain-containing protein [Acidobacteriaceae bacterium]